MMGLLFSMKNTIEDGLDMQKRQYAVEYVM